MSEESSAEEFCYKENGYFPRDEFSDDPTWGRVHNKKPRHTILGTDIDEGLPDVPALPADPPSY